VFGTGSALFDGTGDYLTIPDSADWNMGTGNFTIDFWVRFNNLEDATDSETVLQLSCDGSDATTSFPDDSCDDRTVTAQDDAQVDTAQKKFGTASALFDGTDDYLSVPDSDAWYMAAEPFTIDFWLRPNNYTSSPVLFSQRVDGTHYVQFIYFASVFNLQIYADGMGSVATIMSTASAPSTGVWTHIAVIRGWGGDADDWAITFDGIVVGTATSDSTAWPQLAAPLAIGGYTGSGNKLDGWIDEFRVSKGVARWTTEFAPESAAFSDGDIYTVLFNQQVDADNYARLYLDACNDNLVFSVTDTATETVAISGTWAPVDDTWYHVAVIRGWLEAANGWAITVSGSDVGTVTDASAWSDFAASFDIGKCDDTDFIYHNGWIAEFRVWKGTAAWTADFSPPSRAYGTASGYFIVGSPWKLDGLKLYVASANTTASTLTGEEWSGTAWTTLSNLADGTSSDSISLAQTGSVTWDTTEITSEQKLLYGYDWHWYQFALSAGVADIYYVTVDAPFQDITNLWSGDYSTCVAAKVYEATNGDYWDYSDQVNAETTATVLVADSLEATNDYLLLGFLERQQAIEVSLPPKKENSTASTTLAVYYWDGSDWAAVVGLNDGTSVASISFSQSGVVSWSPPSKSQEFTKSLSGEPLFYYYKLVFDQTLDAEVEIYYIEGVPTTEDVLPYQFPLHFQNRTLLCNRDGAPSEVLVSNENTPYIFNGDDSTTLLVGGDNDLTGGVSLSNSYESSIDAVAILTKNSETWALREPGDGSAYLIQRQLSTMIGCPAPLTMDTFEVGGQNIAFWLSYDGPVMCDGATVRPIPGIEPYFDPIHDSFLTYAVIETAAGFVDPVLREYNILVGEYWLIYDIVRNKWFKKESSSYPECGWRVQDTDGGQYCYLGFDDGYTRRNENGNAWDAANISQSVTLADMFLAGPWYETQLDFLKLTVEAKNTGDQDSVTVKYRGDGATSWTSLTAVPMYETGSPRYVQHTQRPNKQAVSHQLKLECATDDKDKGMEPISLDILYRALRTDTTID
jgi:hypothetical protein